MKQKLLALTLGLAAALLLAEASLRIIGYASGKKEPPPAAAGSANTILCLGDSFTVGAEAAADRNYPRQLERLLNGNKQGLKFAVINGGVPGQNTTRILETLPREIARVKPALIVLLAGGANSWNYYGYYSYRHRGFPARLADLSYKLKIFKLARLLLPGGSGGNPGTAGAPLPEGHLPCLPRPGADKAGDYFREAGLAAGRGDYAQTIELLKKAALLDPENATIAYDLAAVYERLNDGKQRDLWLEKARQAPDECPIGEGDIFSRRIVTNRVSGLPVARWIAADMDRIIYICRESGVPVIMQNYPVLSPEKWSYLPEIHDNIARRNSVPLADNYSAFTHSAGGGRGLFAADPFGHCNAEGYGLMARTVADTIIRIGIFPLKGPL